MSVSVIVKQPAEIVRFRAFDGTAAFPPIEVASIARGLVPGAGALTVSHAVLDAGILLTLSSGTDGERYLVTVRAAGAAGDAHETELEVAVVDGQWTMPSGGVAYLTISEFVDFFGLEEVVRMTDGDGSGRIDRALLVSALRAAQGKADLNLAARYAVPLSVAPPDAIKTAIADIARARLYPRGAPAGVADNAKEAFRVLERIASGATPLPLPPGTAADVATTTDAPIAISPGTRRYPRGTDLVGMSRALDVAITVREDVTRALAEAERLGGDLTAPMGEIATFMVSETVERFRTETDPLGVPWIRSKRVLGLTGSRLGPNKQSGQTLTLKGDLRRSIKGDHGRDFAAAGPEASGGAAEYAAAHQFGFQGPVVVPFHTREVTQRFGKALPEPETEFVSSYVRQMNLPARAYVGFTDQSGEEVIFILGEHIGRAFGGAGSEAGA